KQLQLVSSFTGATEMYSRRRMGVAVLLLTMISWGMMMMSCRADEVDTTLGFTDLPFNTSYYHLHKPYDLPETQRYSFAGGVHRLWAFVPNGTNGACILQVFGGSGEVGHRTTLMLRVYNGSLTYYRSPVLVPSIFDRWFRVNVIHHVAAALLEVYVDGVLLYQAPGRGGTTHFFKLGVYGQDDMSYYMEARWKDVRILWGSSVNGVVDVLDPTCGFTELPFNTSHYSIHKPFDLPVAQRMLQLYNGSTTHPRSEIKIGYTYSSGIWQFEGQGYVPKGTNGVCIMQVFGASRRATSLMLRVYNGSLMYYQRAVIVPEIFDRWFRLNVIHDVEAAALEVYVDGVLLLVVADHGGKSHYFKFGVYGQNNMSDCMESRWKGIRVLYKNVT
ncbi:unnamed protein product, partial [Linum tenue]